MFLLLSRWWLSERNNVEICDEINKKFKPILDNKTKEDFDAIVYGIKKLNELLKDLEKEI